jgi:probable phosphoglycerate mutase
MELYIARHGETESNSVRRLQGGSKDTPLTQKGIAQAKKLAEEIKDIEFDAIYSSPLKRAMDTARIAFGDDRLFEAMAITDSRLLEIGVGEAEDMIWEDAVKAFPGMIAMMMEPAIYVPPSGGESLQDMVARIDSFLNELATKPYNKVFVMAHGYVLRVVYACSLDKSVAAIGKSPIFDNCALVRYRFDKERWNLEYYEQDDTHHPW